MSVAERSFPLALGAWAAKILTLVGESFGDRQRRARLSTLMAVVEPFGVIAVFAIGHSLFFHRPAFGSSTILFLVTGILPFYMFVHVGWRARTWDTMRVLPRSNRFDVALSFLIAELLTKVIILAIACGAFAWMGHVDALPREPLVCLAALGLLGLAGLGVGLINAVLISFLPVWGYVFAILLRGSMLFSGVLFVADRMPPLSREYLSYNPLAHAIILYRSGHYDNYPTLLLDVDFLAYCTGGMLALGALVIVATRPWRPTA